MLFSIILLIIGLVLLIVSGESLVRGASALAKRFNIPPIVIGLTVVAFGTSAPELVVNIFAAIEGTTDIAIGNIIGSNIANILLILGISALILPLRVQKGTVWKELPMALLAAVLVFIMGRDAVIDQLSYSALTRSDGLTLIAFFAIFVYYTFGIAKTESNSPATTKSYSLGVSIIYTALGLVGLFLGGKLLVDSAVDLARLAGLSELLIGATIVAVGTSLPELITSIIAALHKQDDLAVGNIVGSNIFNIFWILGITSIIHPLPFGPALTVDVMMNITATLLLFAFMFIHDKHRLNRWQGAFFILLYISYIAFLLYRG